MKLELPIPFVPQSCRSCKSCQKSNSAVDHHRRGLARRIVVELHERAALGRLRFADHVHRAFRVGRFVVERRRNYAVRQGDQAHRKLDRAAAVPKVAEETFRRGDRHVAERRARIAWASARSSSSVLLPWALT